MKNNNQAEIIKISSLRKNWETIPDKFEEEDIPPEYSLDVAGLYKKFPVLAPIYIASKEDVSTRFVNNYYFNGNINEIHEVIFNRFLTAADISQDASISLRVAQRWLSHSPKQKSKYHISDTISIKNIRDDENPHYQIHYKDGKSHAILYHNVNLGLSHPMTVVSLKSYYDFITTFYSKSISKYEAHLHKTLKRWNKSNLIIHLAKYYWIVAHTKIMMHNNLIRAKLISDDPTTLCPIYKQGLISAISSLPEKGSTPKESELKRSLRTDTPSKIVNKINQQILNKRN